MRPDRKHISEAEFAALAKSSDRRLELWDGEIYDMSYTTPAHRDIVRNLSNAFNARLKAPCVAMQGEPVRPLQTSGLYREPDLVVICGEREIEALHGLALTTNPIVIVEVTSPETEGRDRNEKLDEYKTIASLCDYLIVSQRSPAVTRWARADRAWDEMATFGMKSAIEIASVSVTLQLSEIYKSVKFK